MAFMFETRYAVHPTRFALEAGELQRNYHECWQGLQSHFTEKGGIGLLKAG
jgi:homogentisate 1,2-dioxygenase